MQKINFKDNQEPSISDENLNLLQTNVENAINEAIDNVKLEIKKAENPVGHIRMETTNVNPNTYLGFGTWVLWGKGRVPVGVDTTQTEFNTIEKKGGSKYIQEHFHKDSIDVGGNKQQECVTYKGLQSTGQFYVATSGVLGVQTGNSGNLQPYITCYMWKRIS